MDDPDVVETICDRCDKPMTYRLSKYPPEGAAVVHWCNACAESFKRADAQVRARWGWDT